MKIDAMSLGRLLFLARDGRVVGGRTNVTLNLVSDGRSITAVIGGADPIMTLLNRLNPSSSIDRQT
jgi:hypothetical protein